MFDDIAGEVGDLAESAGGIGGIKDDVVLLWDEAQEIKKEIDELQRIAASLLDRQVRVMEAIGRLKGVANIG
jgi:hypothetical protein